MPSLFRAPTHGVNSSTYYYGRQLNGGPPVAESHMDSPDHQQQKADAVTESIIEVSGEGLSEELSLIGSFPTRLPSSTSGTIVLRASGIVLFIALTTFLWKISSNGDGHIPDVATSRFVDLHAAIGIYGGGGVKLFTLNSSGSYGTIKPTDDGYSVNVCRVQNLCMHSLMKTTDPSSGLFALADGMQERTECNDLNMVPFLLSYLKSISPSCLPMIHALQLPASHVRCL
jgi:hypothetical protein